MAEHTGLEHFRWFESWQPAEVRQSVIRVIGHTGLELGDIGGRDKWDTLKREEKTLPKIEWCGGVRSILVCIMRVVVFV